MKDKLAGSIDLFAETEKLYQCISNRFAQIFVSGIRILFLSNSGVEGWIAKLQDARRTSSLERPESKCAKTRSICAKDGKDLLTIMKLCVYVKSKEGLLGLHHLQVKLGLSSSV